MITSEIGSIGSPGDVQMSRTIQRWRSKPGPSPLDPLIKSGLNNGVLSEETDMYPRFAERLPRQENSEGIWVIEGKWCGGSSGTAGAFQRGPSN